MRWMILCLVVGCMPVSTPIPSPSKHQPIPPSHITHIHQVAGKGKSWVSVGVIQGKAQMVTTPAHRVLLFPNEKGMLSVNPCV